MGSDLGAAPRFLIVALAAMLAAVVAACAGSDGAGSDGAGQSAAGDSGPTQVPAADADAEALGAAYQSDAANFVDASSDSGLPPGAPEVATGVYGFSRYVFLDTGDDIVPTLVEGPRGPQTRCQDVEADCSLAELRAIYDRGGVPPVNLGMDRDTLGTLLGQLAQTAAAVDRYPTLEQACGAGFKIQSSQNPNMGIHAVNPDGTTTEFDPARPQMVLYAKEGGDLLTQADQGNCIDGAWTGEPGYTSVGAAFTLTLTEEHPAAFAGPIDNWHVHYNSCVGSPEEGGAGVTEDPSKFLGSRERCETSGGSFQEIIPVWMIHAYVDPDHDAQGGVFAMFNPSIWPLSDPEEIAGRWIEPAETGVAAPITNFDYGDIAVKEGDTVVFSNSDSVPHTVTAGVPGELSGDFDSGVFGTGQAFSQTFDAAGSYPLFCVLHPGMSTTVVVEAQ